LPAYYHLTLRNSRESQWLAPISLQQRADRNNRRSTLNRGRVARIAPQNSDAVLAVVELVTAAAYDLAGGRVLKSGRSAKGPRGCFKTAVLRLALHPAPFTSSAHSRDVGPLGSHPIAARLLAPSQGIGGPIVKGFLAIANAA
jgi:hypothetical protein